MEALGINLNFQHKQIEWDDLILPMKNRGTVDRDTIESLYSLHKEPSVIKMSEDRHIMKSLG